MAGWVRRVLWWAVAVGVTLLLVVRFAPWLVLPGPVSQGHARIEPDCFACHQPLLGPRVDRCTACHTPDEIGRGGEARLARPALAAFHGQPLARDCFACHTDHQGRDPAAATARFDHDLLPAQQAGACQECHAAPRDALHERITTGCAECHSTTAWRPATFAHEDLFRIDRRHPPDCKSCHPGETFRTYTCYTCHEHSPAKIRREHLEEGIGDYEPCAVCHRSANEDDAKRRWRELRRQGLSPSAAAARDRVSPHVMPPSTPSGAPAGGGRSGNGDGEDGENDEDDDAHEGREHD